MIFPLEPRNIAGRDNLAYWEGFLSPQDIKTILSLPEWKNTDRAMIGHVSGGVVNESVRRTNIGWMHPTQETTPIWNKISSTVSEVNRRFFHFDLDGCYEPAQLGAYTAEDNGHYNWHTDASMSDANAPRKLSMVLSLSDPCEFEGGELQVKIENDEAQTLQIAKGRAWFFPSWVLHRVTPVTKGVRRSLVLWVGGPPFK
jgi:PKHD-type hydroxylase